MNISIFDVTGPVMVGPSSSHTAGAARLARIAGLMAAAEYDSVSFGLHGSFAKTYKGHGTDRALLAGVLGLREDDERLVDAFQLAEERGLAYDFYETELDGLHENSVKITFSLAGDGDDASGGRGTVEVIGSSIGGGRIIIHSVDGFQVNYTGESSALIIRQLDKAGVVSEVTRIMAMRGLNIAMMRLSRSARGELACCVIETDGDIPPQLVEEVEGLRNIFAARAVNLGRGA